MNKLNKTILWIVVIIIIAGSIWLGYQKEDDIVEGEVIKIGAIHALSGNNFVYGDMMRRGIDLAVKEYNSESQERKIEVVYEDHQANPTTAINAFNFLKSQEINIISTSFSNVILALSPLAMDSETILISSGATSKEIKEQGKFIISTIPDSGFEVPPLAEYTFDMGYRRAGIIYVNYQFGIDQKNTFKEEFEKLGGEIVSEEAEILDSKDFKTTLLKIKNKNPDILFIGTLGKETTLIIKQAKELGIDIPLITTQTSISMGSLKEIGDLANGLIIAGPRFDLENKEELFVRFKDNFLKEYNQLPDYFATTYYDSTKIILLAIDNCMGDKNIECLLDYILSIKDYNGVSGKTTFIGTSVEKPIDLKIFMDGEIKTIESQ